MTAKFNPNVADLKTRQALQRIKLAVDQLDTVVSDRDPTGADNASEGYAVGAKWINTTNDTMFVLMAIDAIAGDATWHEVASTRTTGPSFGGFTFDTAVDYVDVRDVAGDAMRRATLDEITALGINEIVFIALADPVTM